MKHGAREARPSVIAGVFRRPSSRLGWAAAGAMAGSIGLVFVNAAISVQGTDDVPGWQAVLFAGILLCLLASYVMGLVAVFRSRERSWVVLLPTALISAAIVNELVQGILQLVGVGER